MATITGGEVFIVLATVLAGGLDKPPVNWTEVDAQAPQYAYRQLDQQGCLSGSHPGDKPQAAPSGCHEKISPQDFFRIVEIAPKAVKSPAALKEPPAGAEALLRIRTSDGTNYYFAGEREKFRDGNAQEIWTILRKYRSESW